MKLYLVQHGKALSKEEDPSRSLSEEGIKDVRRVAGVLASFGVAPREIHHSGKMRALQSAQIFAEVLGTDAVPVQSDGLAPNDDPEIWARRLQDAGDDIMLVGHLPHVAALASLLLCGRAEAAVKFSMGGVLCLQREEEGRWAVDWFIKPELIQRADE